MRVLVTGATGFTGAYVVPLLLDRGYQVRCLVRHTSNRKILSGNAVEWYIGNLGDKEALRRSMEGVEILVNIASIGFGHSPNIISSAKGAGISRAIFMSTTALFTTLNTSSKAIRQAAENSICGSGLAYTILRPTMIYGSSRDRNMCRLIQYLNRWPLIPLFGSGEYLQQPVYVGDVAGAVVDALSTDRTMGKAYNIPGAEALTFNQVIDTICQALGRRVQKIHFPAAPFLSALNTAERLGLRIPIKAEQIARLNENKAFDFGDAHKDFGYSPHSFSEGISLELREMGIIGSY